MNVSVDSDKVLSLLEATGLNKQGKSSDGQVALAVPLVMGKLTPPRKVVTSPEKPTQRRDKEVDKSMSTSDLSDTSDEG